MAAQKDKKRQPSKGGVVELSEKDLNVLQGGGAAPLLDHKVDYTHLESIIPTWR